jgi:transcriptional regulator with XRE-family HTH domain
VRRSCAIRGSTSFGDLLRGLRRAASLSQEELAQRARLSVKAVGALERGERQRPYPNTVRALADALEVSSEVRAALMDSARRDTGEGQAVPESPLAPRGAVDPEQQAAAWELYVELVTRIAMADPPAGEGILREALSSLHSLFAAIRAILRLHGPAVARTPGGGPSEVSALAIAVLDEVLRPLFTVWHPLLLDHESRRPAGLSAVEHERSWERNQEMREALALVRGRLDDQARRLAAVAEVPHPLGSGLATPP